MTGKEFKQFVSDKGWSTNEAIELFGISRTTLFRQYRRDKVSNFIASICRLIVLQEDK